MHPWVHGPSYGPVTGQLFLRPIRRGFDPKLAPLYAQALVGMVALTGQWWLDVRRPKKAVVAAHLVYRAWHGLAGLEAKPRLIGRRKS